GGLDYNSATAFLNQTAAQRGAAAGGHLPTQHEAAINQLLAGLPLRDQFDPESRWRAMDLMNRQQLTGAEGVKAAAAKTEAEGKVEQMRRNNELLFQQMNEKYDPRNQALKGLDAADAAGLGEGEQI